MKVENPYAWLREKIARSVHSVCDDVGFDIALEEVMLRTDYVKEQFGDISSSIAFDLCRRVKRPPNEIAMEIASNLDKEEFVEEAKVVGGYINFFLKTGKLCSFIINEILGNDDYGKRTLGDGKKVIVEFPSVNPNKPWHIGHMRNALLGDSVSRILEFAGYHVERIDYINDLGLQVAQSVWGYIKVNNKIEGKVDHWVGRQYVSVAKKAEEPEVKEQVKEILKALENGEGEIADVGRDLAMRCVLAQHETAFRLGIFHNALIWESDIVRSRMFETALRKAMESGKVVEEREGPNAGCIVAKLGELEEFKDMENPDKVLVRSDGTAVYTGKDLAFQMWKFGIIPSNLKFRKLMEQPNGKDLFTTDREGKSMGFGSADIVINVIGSEQKYPQKVLKLILKLLGYNEAYENSIHLSYEHATIPEGRLSGRKGTWIGFTADELLERTVKEAKNAIKDRFPDMGLDEKERIAEMVGIGAIRFDFLRTSPEKKIIFKWEDALSFEGDTGPYIQYSYARARRILEKAGEYGEGDPGILSSEYEKRLAIEMARFPDVVGKSAKELKPNYIADYLLDLSGRFSKFYQNCPVIKSKRELKNARLALVESYARVVKNALHLLGIKAPERM